MMVPMNSQVMIVTEMERALQEKTARVAVVGLGHVGLPLAERFVATGFDTVGIDTDGIKVDEVNSHNGGAYSPESELVASKDYDAISSCEVVCVCVPTGIDQHLQPDLAHIKAATQQIAKRLHPGQLIVVESTVFPGATEEFILPILSESGLSVGRDYYLGYSRWHSPAHYSCWYYRDRQWPGPHWRSSGCLCPLWRATGTRDHT